MPGYDQPTASSSRKAVDKLPSPTRPQPESHAGQGYARESSVCSDIGPSLTIKQRPETPQQNTQHARAEPEHPASPKPKPTIIFPALKKKSVGRSAYIDHTDLIPLSISPSKVKTISSASLPSTDFSLKNRSSTDFSKDLSLASLSSRNLCSSDFSKSSSSASISASDSLKILHSTSRSSADLSSTDLSLVGLSKNLRPANVPLTDSSSTDFSTTSGANSQTLDRLSMNAVPADAEDAKQPKNTVLKTLDHSAEPAKEESAAPATVASRSDPSPFQHNMSPPPTSGLRPTMTTARSPSSLTASRAPAAVKRHASLAPRLPIRVHSSPSSSVSPLTPGRKCMWCGGREHASVDCDKVCTQCGSSSHTRGGCGSSSGF